VGRLTIARTARAAGRTPDLFGLDLAGIEQWIRVNAPKKRA
jgi:hypothetical protein